MKNRKLKQIFDFTDEDLEANQQGYLTQRQYTSARSKFVHKQFSSAIGFLVCIAFLFIGLFLLFRWLQDPTDEVWILALVLIVGGGFGVIGIPYSLKQQTRAIQQDTGAGIVERYAGMGMREKREIQTRSGKQTYYYVRVGMFNFGSVDEDTYGAFLNEHCYAVYYLPHSRHVVAVEMIECLEMDAPPKKEKRIAAVEEIVDIPALPPAKEVTYLVYSLRGQGTYRAAIKWYTAQDQAPRIAWEQQGNNAHALHQQAISRLPKVTAQLQNRGWQVTSQQDQGSVDTENAAFRQVITLERTKTENK